MTIIIIKRKLGWKEQKEFYKEVSKLEDAWKIKKIKEWMLIESNLE